MNMDDLGKHFVEQGWLVLDLANGERSVVFEVRQLLLQRLRDKWLPGLESLDRYHEQVRDDELHVRIQEDLSARYRDSGLGPALIKENLAFFQTFLGLDIHVQKHPYLRIARPGKPQDNIGIHRDTHYGCTPYELSVSVPFTDTGIDGVLGVVPGTHLLAESDLPVRQFKSPDVEMGSTKHKLGFLYAPKEMSAEVRAKVVPIAVRPGQALVFSLSLVHGQEVNRSNVTRFQSDIRVVNSLAPIQWERNVYSDYYQPLSVSPVTAQARRYDEANKPCNPT